MAFSVDEEVHAKFEIWCKRQNRSLRGALRQMVIEAVAGIELQTPTKTTVVADRPAPAQRQARPITMTVAEAREFLESSGRLKDADRLYAARICVGDTEEEAQAFMRTTYDRVAIDPFEPPVTQAAWIATRALNQDAEEEEFVLDPDAAYREHRAEGLTHDEAVERVKWSCECNHVTGWVPPEKGEAV